LKKTFGRKLALCHEGWKANRHVELFGAKQLRVAIVQLRRPEWTT